uniref:Trypsin Inhibitor like cysteine rich domain protein n=1 Tax=Syphacia muris TaxID=451379 RepID=A0A0N5AIX9_9BILA
MFTVNLKPINILAVHVVKECSENENFHTCAPDCEPTCAIPKPKCGDTCVLDVCRCMPGFVRYSNGSCISADTCPKNASKVISCGENEKFTNCGTACEPSCAIPEPTVCKLDCVVDVCQCEVGFVRNSKNKCVKISECANEIEKNKYISATCSLNEKFMECGSACEPTCNEPFPSFCTDYCVPNVCQCAPGFVRNHKNECVLFTDCTPANITCDKTERFMQCGTACEPTCEVPDPDGCTKKCLLNVCQCREGLVRNSDGKCVQRRECQNNFDTGKRNIWFQRISRRCGLNEVMKTGPACEEPTCKNPNPTQCMLSSNITTCSCKTGYLRDENNSCIPASQCKL